MAKEKEYSFTVTIQVKVKSKLSLQDAKEEFGNECGYELPSTENVQVVETEWLDTEQV